VETALTRSGLTIECMLPSKKAHFFEGQKGAVLFRTNAGDFEVLFVPEPNTFAGLEIAEERKGSRFIYSFRGKPETKHYFDSAYGQYFLKQSNKLFISFDQQTAVKLNAVFGTN